MGIVIDLETRRVTTERVAKEDLNPYVGNQNEIIPALGRVGKQRDRELQREHLSYRLN